LAADGADEAAIDGDIAGKTRRAGAVDDVPLRMTRSCIDAEQRVAEQRLVGAQIRRHRAAEQAHEQTPRASTLVGR
jgi:hypothetical protein